MPKPSLLSELKRRRVLHVAGVYIAVTFMALQGADLLIEALRLPAWTLTMLVVVALFGFPIAVGLAWAFDVTPDGVRRAAPTEAEAVAGRSRAVAWVGLGLVVALVGIGAYAGLGRRAATAEADGRIQSIAVLPFADMSAARDQEYFGDGLAEELLDALAQIEGLRVPARTSSFQFKGQNVDIREVGQKLGVQAVLEGSVRKAGDRLRITAQLIKADDGYHLWSESYDREMDDIFAVQEEIARAIVDALRIQLPGASTERLVQEHTADPEAYTLYLRGRYVWNKRTREGLEQAATLFQQAVERDPKYALAYAGLADALHLQGTYGYMPTREAYAQARSAAERALELDPHLAEAHASLSLSLGDSGEWSAASEALRRAIELKPSYATAHHWYALHLHIRGQREEALREIQRAVELDPLSPAVNTAYGLLLRFEKRWNEALRQWDKVLALEPDQPTILAQVAMTRADAGDVKGAIRDGERAVAIDPANPTYRLVLAGIYDRVGRTAEARRILAELEPSVRGTVHAVFAVPLYARLGDLDQAFAWLDATTWQMNGWLYLTGDPIFEPMRADPRYRQFLEKAGLR